MTTVRLEHAITDFARWKQAFDRDRSTARAWASSATASSGRRTILLASKTQLRIIESVEAATY